MTGLFAMLACLAVDAIRNIAADYWMLSLVFSPASMYPCAGLRLMQLLSSWHLAVLQPPQRLHAATFPVLCMSTQTEPLPQQRRQPCTVHHTSYAATASV
jgi:hypothetical protein